MSRRIEIELTSTRPDGMWTWRAAGAQQPKGLLDGALLPSGAAAGLVMKADAEFELTEDGQEALLDLRVEDNRIALPADLLDANRFRFDVQQSGRA